MSIKRKFQNKKSTYNLFLSSDDTGTQLFFCFGLNKGKNTKITERTLGTLHSTGMQVSSIKKSEIIYNLDLS